MTTTLFLVRHGDNDTVGLSIAGRALGVHLNAEGRAQAQAVADRLAREEVSAIYASPLERTQETAAPLAERLKLSVTTSEGLNELDFGDWTDKPLEELHKDPRWNPWNSQRTLHRPPGGESMGECQMRAVHAVEAIRSAHDEAKVVLVSHGDVIKSLVCHWLGLNLDYFHRFDINPGSVTKAVVGDWGAKLLRINEGA